MSIIISPYTGKSYYSFRDENNRLVMITIKEYNIGKQRGKVHTPRGVI